MVIYTYKDNRYFTVREVSMKNPSTGEWEPAIMYSPVEWDKSKGLTPIYIRAKGDFYNKFKRVDE